MRTSERFQDARDRIVSPNSWIKWHLAENLESAIVDPTDPTAVCWCAMGTLARSYNNNFKINKVLTVVDPTMGESPIDVLNIAVNLFVNNNNESNYIQFNGAMPLNLTSFNDASVTTHADILAVFDKAIEIATLFEYAKQVENEYYLSELANASYEKF